jgi:hypothetical protein
MYTINYVEDGRFVTNIGAPARTLAECTEQIDKLTKSTDRKQLDTYVGCKWDRNGVTCVLYITDELGLPISNKEQEDA